MGEAGFAPAGMAGMFDKLDQSSRLNDSGGFPYLRSHPLTVDRIGEARQAVQAVQAVQAGGDRPADATAAGSAAARSFTPLLHGLMQARARVLMDPSTQALRRLQDFDSRGDVANLPLADRVVGLYTGALASAQLRDIARAGRAADAAQALLGAPAQAHETQARYTLDQLVARLAMARGDLARAYAVLGAEASPARAGLLLAAELALADGTASALRHSAEALQTWVSEHREDATAWQLLSQTTERQGQRLRSLRASAEHEAALGNLPGAIDRLRAGQQAARLGGASTDFIEASVIDARLRDLMAQRRELVAEQRKQGGGSRNEPGSEQ